MSKSISPFWDVIIIGAGPAGAVAAQQCAAHGVSVLLVDRTKFPRHKVCGCCLNSVALGVLDHLGMAEAVRAAGGAMLTQLDLSARGQRVRLDLPPGLAISRAALDAALIDRAVAEGAAFLPQTLATVGGIEGQARQVTVRIDGRDRQFRARLVVAATGLAGFTAADEPDLVRRPVRSARIGCSAILDHATEYSAGVIHMISGRGGYVGLTRLEDGRLNVAAAIDPTQGQSQGGVRPLIGSIMQSAGRSIPAGLDRARWKGTPRLTGRPRRLAGDRLVLIGDAAGYVEPFTGEGMAWAMITGWAAAELMAQTRFEADQVTGRWHAEYRRLLAVRQRRCGHIVRLLRSPFLTGWVIRALAAHKGLAASLVRAIHRPASPCSPAPVTESGI